MDGARDNKALYGADRLPRLPKVDSATCERHRQLLDDLATHLGASHPDFPAVRAVRHRLS